MHNEQKKVIFDNFLNTHELRVEYTGAKYILVNNQKNIIVDTNTSEELYTFIKGFNFGMFYNKKQVEDLKKQKTELEEQNRTNVERYEEIIKAKENV